MAEDDGLDVLFGHSFHAQPGRREVVAEQWTREGHLPSTNLEGIADEQEALTPGVEADASRGMTGRVDHLEAAQNWQHRAIGERDRSVRRPGGVAKELATGRARQCFAK